MADGSIAGQQQSQPERLKSNLNSNLIGIKRLAQGSSDGTGIESLETEPASPAFSRRKPCVLSKSAEKYDRIRAFTRKFHKMFQDSGSLAISNRRRFVKSNFTASDSGISNSPSR